MRQKKAWQAAVSLCTLGVLNFGSDGCIVKDPITAVGNTIKHAKDHICKQSLE